MQLSKMKMANIKSMIKQLCKQLLYHKTIETFVTLDIGVTYADGSILRSKMRYKFKDSIMKNKRYMYKTQIF